MDLARFHRAIHIIDIEYKTSRVIDRLNKLIQGLNQLAANPSDTSISKIFKQDLDTLRISLHKSQLNESDDPTLRQLIVDLNIEKFVGQGLFDWIKQAIETNQLSPNLASAALTQVRDQIGKKYELFTAINAAFTELEISYFRLEDGEAEMLIDLPVDQATKTLDDLSKEAKEWHRICEAIGETFDPDRKPITIDTIATGSWLIYLAGTPVFIAGVAKCLKGVNAILQELIKMKSLYAQLVESKAPQTVLDGLNEHNSAKVKTDLDKLASDLVDEHYKGNDIGRKNELRNALSQALNRLSRKLADGAKVNLRLTLPKKPEIPEDQEPTPEQQQSLEALETAEKLQLVIDQARPALNFEEHLEDLQKALPPPNAD